MLEPAVKALKFYASIVCRSSQLTSKTMDVLHPSAKNFKAFTGVYFRKVVLHSISTTTDFSSNQFDFELIYIDSHFRKFAKLTPKMAI